MSCGVFFGDGSLSLQTSKSFLSVLSIYHDQMLMVPLEQEGQTELCSDNIPTGLVRHSLPRARPKVGT